MATTAPQRDNRAEVAHPEDGPPARTTRSRLVMLLNVVLIAGVAIIGITHLKTDPSEPAATGPTAGPASVLRDQDAVPTPTPTPTPTAQTSSEPPTTEPTRAAEARAPKVPIQLRSSFVKGDGWPYGAGFRETGRLAWPLGIVDGLMTHGAAQSPNSVSWLEKWLKNDVRRIGARVLFAPNHSGTAAMTAWHTSVLDTTGLAQPRTGMRLAVRPGGWQLVALDSHGQSVISSGTYTQTGHSASFDLVRRDSTLWLTDPNGHVTKVEDPRIGSLSGPWASWELRDGRVGSRPAGFQEIWAG
jgi:hypothetical protein